MPGLIDELKEEFAKDPLGTIVMTFNLAVIAFFLLVPEYLRYIGCRVTGQKYRLPTQRIVEGVENDGR